MFTFVEYPLLIGVGYCEGAIKVNNSSSSNVVVIVVVLCGSSSSK
jgi:hypothetical protein